MTTQEGEAPVGPELAAATDFDRRLSLGIGHLALLTAVLSVWTATDAWRLITGLAVAGALSVLAAIPAGVVFSTLLHEWCHLLGARLARAAYRALLYRNATIAGAIAAGLWLVAS